MGITLPVALFILFAQPVPSRWEVPLRLRPLRSAWRQESARPGPLTAPTPRTSGSFGHFHYALHFAPSSTVHNLWFKALCLRWVRGRIQLAALVSGIVVPPQPDPDVTQARCSITDCPATPASRLALTMTSAHLVLHSISFAARCSRYARGYRCCSPLTHSHRTLPLYATLASAFTAHRHRQSTKSPQNGCLPRFC